MNVLMVVEIRAVTSKKGEAANRLGRKQEIGWQGQIDKRVTSDSFYEGL